MTENSPLSVMIMAAGKGTRMKSDLPKVLHKLHGRAMVHYVIETAKAIDADPVVVIIGHMKEMVTEELKDASVSFALQEPQLGTGHAVMCAIPKLENCSGDTLILSGDVPLISQATLKTLHHHHIETGATASVLTAITENPKGYGRIIRRDDGSVEAITEERDATDTIRKIKEINSGIYIFKLNDLRRVLPLISNKNDQKEYYLTDAIRILTKEGKTVSAVEGRFQEAMGINTVAELDAAHLLSDARNFPIG